MAICKICKNFGIFLKVSKAGMCKSCEAFAKVDLAQRSKIIKDSVKLVNSGKSLETRLGRYKDLMIQVEHVFEKYEKNGVYLLTPKAQDYLKLFGRKEEEIVADWFIEKEIEIQSKVEYAQSQKDKIKILTKFAIEVKKNFSSYPSDKLSEVLRNTEKLLFDLQSE